MVSEKQIQPKYPLNDAELKLLENVDAKKDEIYSLLQELVKIDSRNYSEFIYSDRIKIMEFAKSKMEEFGFSTELIKSPFIYGVKRTEDGADVKTDENLFHYNLIAKYKGENPGKNLQFNGHLDIVPYNEEKWNKNTPPLGGVIIDNKLFGRGACDMKAGVACQMMAMKFLKDSGMPVNGSLQMWFVPDEETHGAYGSKFMTVNHLDKVNTDATIISESSAMKPLISPAFSVGEKGPYWFKLTFYGASGHGSMPKSKSNALNKAVRFMANADKKLKIPKKKAPLSIFALLKTLLKRYKLSNLPEMLSATSSGRDPLDEDGMSIGSMFKTTYSFDKITAGSKVNVIPDKCELEIDIRALPGLTGQELIDAFSKYCTKLNYRIDIPEKYNNIQKTNAKIQSRPIDIKLEILTEGAGSFADPSTEFGDLISESFKSIYQVEPVHFFSSGFTDAGNMREGGMKDIFVFGPSGGNFHEANEFVELDSLINVTKTYLLTAYRFLCK